MTDTYFNSLNKTFQKCETRYETVYEQQCQTVNEEQCTTVNEQQCSTVQVRHVEIYQFMMDRQSHQHPFFAGAAVQYRQRTAVFHDQ